MKKSFYNITKEIGLYLFISLLSNILMASDYVGPDEIEEGPSWREVIEGAFSLFIMGVIFVVLRNIYKAIFNKNN